MATKAAIPGRPFSANTQRKSLWGWIQLVLARFVKSSLLPCRSEPKESSIRSVKLPAPTPVRGWLAIILTAMPQTIVRPPSLGPTAWCGRETTSRSMARPMGVSVRASPPPTTAMSGRAARPAISGRRKPAGRPSTCQWRRIAIAPPAAAAAAASHAARDWSTASPPTAASPVAAATPRHAPLDSTAAQKHQGTTSSR